MLLLGGMDPCGKVIVRIPSGAVEDEEDGHGGHISTCGDVEMNLYGFIFEGFIAGLFDDALSVLSEVGVLGGGFVVVAPAAY